MTAERAMTEWGDTALRLRDSATIALMAVAGPVCAIFAVAVMVMRRSIGQPPALEYLAVAMLFIVIAGLMVLTRWRIAHGRPATAMIGTLAIIHGLAGAVFLRVALGGSAESSFPAYAAAYMIAMAVLLAWCARVPIRWTGGSGT
jgi:hypothetical protein